MSSSENHHHHHHHHHQPNKEQQRSSSSFKKDMESSGEASAELRHVARDYLRRVANKSSKNTLLMPFFITFFFLVSFVLFMTTRLLSSSTSSLYISPSSLPQALPPPPIPCSDSDAINNTICCDRSSSYRSDICFMRGDVRTHSPSFTLFLHLPHEAPPNQPFSEMRIRPYTRKWEAKVMSTIDELHLKPEFSPSDRPCDVRHDVPAIVFSTGGYTGNVYHEFNDGLIPIFITTAHFNKQVVVILLEYHDWWITKYGDVLSQISYYPIIDFSKENRTLCFPEAIIGLRIHDELSIDPTQMPFNSKKTIHDFRNILEQAYKPRILPIAETEEKKPEDGKKLRLVIISRKGSREIVNERELVLEAEDIGFDVEILLPNSSTQMAKMYKDLNNSDVMIGVHGAAMTHLLFMRPGSVFIQIVPLGTDWAAQSYYGDPAKKMGLRYMAYKILTEESSLYLRYPMEDPVLKDPESVNAKGWEMTKKVYLDGQNVMLDLQRFREYLVEAHKYLVSRRREAFEN